MTKISDAQKSSSSASRVHWALLLTGLAALGWSFHNPFDRTLWYQEAGPALVGGIILVCTYRRFRMSTVSYSLLWFFSLILIYGGHYSYARTPLGNVFQEAFDLSRNHFDRFGHFFQGVMPALVGRELIVRTTPLKQGKWLFVLCCSLALSISACYEFIEWAAAVTSEAEDFVGSQGDIWDAHWDMLLALLGAITAQLALSRLQTRQIEQLTK